MPMLHRTTITITIFAILLTALVSFAVPASASDPIKFKPAVPIPGMNIPAEGIDITPTTVGEYIKTIYTFSVYAGSILAVVVLMIGGFMWLTAGGNVSQVGQARTYIGGAISGFVLLLLSWTILQMVNPRLVEFRPIVVNEVGRIDLEQPGTPFCCICNRGSDMPPTDCIEVREPTGGTCTCPGGSATPVPNETACKSFEAGCQFSPNNYSDQRQVNLAVCKSNEARLGLFCDLAVSDGRCAETPQCAEVLSKPFQADRIGSCGDDAACSSDQGYSCNHAWECKTPTDIGRPLNVGGEASNVNLGCCKPLGVYGDVCIRNEECAQGYVCEGGSEGDASLWRWLRGGNYANPPRVGECKS